MLFPHCLRLPRRAVFVGSALILAVSFVSAQSPSSQKGPEAANSSTSAFSSSNDSNSVQFAEFAAPANLLTLPSAPRPALAAAGQEQGGRGWKREMTSKLAFEVGGGFNAPHPDSSPYITWGGQFTVGAGVNFNPRFALLAEYQLIHDKLPGNLIAETGANGGYANIWSLTLDPVVSLFPKSTNDIYVTGGGGFYRKVTSFTDPQEVEYCDYFYGYCGIGTQNVVVGHFSSNQGGVNIGAGYQRRFGGMYHDSKMKLYVEARYVDVFTPAVTGVTPNGLGVTTVAADTKLIPISVGLRW